MLFLGIFSWKGASCFNERGEKGGGCFSDGGPSFLSGEGGGASWGASVLMGGSKKL